MASKLFTPSEANSLLPRITPLLRRLMGSHHDLALQQQVVDAFRHKATYGGGALASDHLAEVKQEIARLSVILQEGLREMASWGCLVKDLDQGLVDFPALRGTERVLLCWRLGEPEVLFWHGLEEGFAGRKPIRDDFSG